ncbi:MAG TPA: DUF192 domain-containing protein [Candidatus Omnitrophota bacterium]|nr:DUF192 domain-containing protein [Candidatus Omnitrophota bacterium]
MRVFNQTKNLVVSDQAVMADSLFARMKGLLGRRFLPQGAALILKPCNSVHTLFMRFTIDVVFLTSSGKVVGIVPCLQPWRFSKIFISANFAVEFPAGTVQSANLSKGDILQIQ